MKKALSFNDVLIVPGFTTTKSRKDVSLAVDFMGEKLTLPVLSAPMDTVTSTELAMALHAAGGLACLHRFQPIAEQCVQFAKVKYDSAIAPIVAVGLNDNERLSALIQTGANKILLDVAHGGMQSVVDWTKEIQAKYPHVYIMLGNFSSPAQIIPMIDAGLKGDKIVLRLGVGGGSACTTRIKTGCGVPTLSSVMWFKDSPIKNAVTVADGGMKTPGDICKALAAGASVVMLGGMLAGTDESPGKTVVKGATMWDRAEHSDTAEPLNGEKFKSFRGSAAASSYKDQGKEWATAEGEEFLIPYKGSVKNVLAEIEGGLRSAMTYVGVDTLTELAKNATFVEVTNNGYEESKAHGKKV